MRFTILVVGMLTTTSYIWGVPHIDIVVIIACMGAFDYFQRHELEKTRLLLTQQGESSSQKQARHEVSRQAKWITQLCEQKHKLAAELVTQEDNHAREIHDIKIRYARRQDTNYNSSSWAGTSIGSIGPPGKYHRRERRHSEYSPTGVNNIMQTGGRSETSSLDIDNDLQNKNNTLEGFSFASTVASSHDKEPVPGSPVEHKHCTIRRHSESVSEKPKFDPPYRLRPTRSADSYVFPSMLD